MWIWSMRWCAVGIAKVLVGGQAEHGGRRLSLTMAVLDQLSRVNVALDLALIAGRADHEVNLRALIRPAGQRAGTGDLGIVGMGVDGQHPAGPLRHRIRG